jgi:Tol biopolymer transport system component
LRVKGGAAVKAFVSTVCTAVLFFVLAGNALAALPGANGKILFQSTRSGGNWEIFSVNPDGTAQTNLSMRPTAVDLEGRWSPDGSKIAFVSDPEGGYGTNSIYLMNADGSGVTKLTDSGGEPTWSPDGSKIAFGDSDGNNSEIFVMNAEGSGRTNITNDPSTNDIEPAWSPDGSKIAFVKTGTSGIGPQYSIYVMNADGSGQTQLTGPHPGFFTGDQEPDWSPNGQKIAYTHSIGSDEEGIFSGIFVMDSDGGNQTQLTGYEFDGSPHWSPDGKRIVFASTPGISTMNPDGTGLVDIVLRATQPFGGESLDVPSDWGRIPTPGPQRGDYKNAAQFCNAKREFMGKGAFEQAYGSAGLGRCVAADAG